MAGRRVIRPDAPCAFGTPARRGSRPARAGEADAQTGRRRLSEDTAFLLRVPAASGRAEDRALLLPQASRVWRPKPLPSHVLPGTWQDGPGLSLAPCVQLMTRTGRHSKPAFKCSVFCEGTQITHVLLLI